ncbi:MAG TPA: DUF2339 domain-containing protein [Rhizobiales bacterium]|nr:DUF2339 domain-containing protein [Hyphomicrobiales bacterium]
MLELLSLVGVVGLIAVVYRQQQRIQILEFDLEGIRNAFLAHREAAMSGSYASAQAGTAEAAPSTKAGDAQTPVAAPAAAPEAGSLPGAIAARAEAASPAEPDAVAAAADASAAAPEGEGAAAGPRSRPGAAEPPAAGTPVKGRSGPDIETALGTRWAVWVGGLALALGGVFLIRYTIEAGIFGPEVRLALAALLGLVLVAGGEVLRRMGFDLPVEGLKNAYLPAILTAAGAFTLFGTIYAAHGIYGFVGPGAAFALLGLVGIATIAASLLHGQALAGIGLVGSYATPLLVASQAPNLWALFGFIAAVLVASGIIARLRDWVPLMIAAFAGAGLWCLVYLADDPLPDIAIVLFANAVAVAVMVFVWLRRAEPVPTRVDGPAAVSSAFVALAALATVSNETLATTTGMATAAALLLGLLASALYRESAVAALFASAAGTVLAYLHVGLGGTFEIALFHETLAIEGTAPGVPAGAARGWGALLALAFLAAGLWSARRYAADRPLRAASWSATAALVPLAVLTAVWVAFGNLDRDLSHAALAFALAVALAAGGEWVAAAERPACGGGSAVSFLLGGAGFSLLLFLHMGFGPFWTTVLTGFAVALPAYATRLRTYPVLGWLSVGAAIAVVARFVIDPTVAGADRLSTTPVFNALLPGYGVPALCAAYAAWQLARTTDGRPRLVMEATATLFGLLAVAMLVRHAMNGGVIDTGAPTLAEQSIYTLIAIGAGAILMALDGRAPSPVFRIGSIAVGVVSVALVAVQHFFALNPLLTNESTGQIPFFNLLLLGYFLPGVAMAGLAAYARHRRPYWYVAALALVASLLGFAYASLSLRRLFQGEYIGLWKDFGQLETYSYSALWLALGVALLAAGLLLRSQVLRLASAALVVVAVAKVFLLDMAELEGVLRALSFIGLGAVLIGIGLFYQRMLTRLAAAEHARAAAS